MPFLSHLILSAAGAITRKRIAGADAGKPLAYAIIGKPSAVIGKPKKEISLSEMVKASTMRWPIEQCFEEGKSQVGMDCYEHRSWPCTFCCA